MKFYFCLKNYFFRFGDNFAGNRKFYTFFLYSAQF